MDKPEKLLRTGELAELLGVSPKSVTRLVHEKGLPVEKTTPVGGHCRYRWSAVVEWLEEQQAQLEAKKQARRDHARQVFSRNGSGRA